LFDDLEARAAALAAADRESEVVELTRLETSRLQLDDRLRGALGTVLRVRCGAGLRFDGRLSRLGGPWLLLTDEAGREVVIVRDQIASIAGLGRVVPAPSGADVIGSRLGLAHLLRAIARDRSVVQAYLSDASVLDGTFDRVAADFAELALHAGGEVRRRDEVREVITVPLSAVVAIRR
jgi:hypothetical protein